jgi:hypothetical protein
MRIVCKSRDWHVAIDEMWEEEEDYITCPECERELAPDAVECFNCTAIDYLEE